SSATPAQAQPHRPHKPHRHILRNPITNAHLGPRRAAPGGRPCKIFVFPTTVATKPAQDDRPRDVGSLSSCEASRGAGSRWGASAPSERRPNGGPQGPEEASDAVSAARAADWRREAPTAARPPARRQKHPKPR